jgi:hypothetical protein
LLPNSCLEEVPTLRLGAEVGEGVDDALAYRGARREDRLRPQLVSKFLQLGEAQLAMRGAGVGKARGGEGELLNIG